MTREEIRASGLLELYALGQLSAEEERTVRAHLETFPELRDDLRAIERALEAFGHAGAISPPPGILDKILHEISGGERPPAPPSALEQERGVSGWWRWIAILGILGALTLYYLMQQKEQQIRNTEIRLQAVLDSCSTENQQYMAQLDQYRQLTENGVEILHMTGTEKYPQTDLYIYHNPIAQRNIIQVRSLPPIDANQSYQLWSLKPDVAPIPLDVFQGGDTLIQVQYEDASQSYAITIEPRGGRQTPTLEDLIGIVNVGG